MEITLNKADIETAIKQYMQATFNMDVPTIEFSNVKGKITAAVSLEKPEMVQMGKQQLTVLPKITDTTPFEEPEPESTKTSEPKKEPAKPKAQAKKTKTEPKKETKAITKDDPFIEETEEDTTDPFATDSLTEEGDEASVTGDDVDTLFAD